MEKRPAEWRTYARADGDAVRISATMTGLPPCRVDVDDRPDAVTITLYEHLPESGRFHPVGVSAAFEIPLPTPLAGRPLIDGATGERRDERQSDTPPTRLPVGEDFSWQELTGRRWLGQVS
jgi:hypothetical protein